MSQKLSVWTKMFLRHRRQVVCDEFYKFIRRSERREIDIPKRCFKALQLIDTIYLIDERKNLAFLPFLKNNIYFRDGISVSVLVSVSIGIVFGYRYRYRYQKF